MEEIPYRLIRSSRKSIAIQVSGEGAVTVRAPKWVSQADISRFYEEKQPWVRRKVAEASARAGFVPKEGAMLPLLGQPYPLRFTEEAANPHFDWKSFVLPESCKVEPLVGIEDAYKQLAKDFLPRGLEEISRRTGLVYTGVRVTSAKGRWGSCSGKNSINLSWRLLFVPPDLIDYVLLHELAHTVHHNHSAAFWQLVETHMPDYRQRRKRLQQVTHIF